MFNLNLIDNVISYVADNHEILKFNTNLETLSKFKGDPRTGHRVIDFNRFLYAIFMESFEKNRF